MAKALLEAYCNELQRVVTVKEVWDFLFNETHSTKEQLTFKCPSPTCSAKLIKRNFMRYGSAGGAQFRLYQKERHAEDCPYRRTGYSKKTKQRKGFLRYYD